MRSLVHTIDLNFRNIKGTIASYLIPHRNGAVLVECGPSTTIPALQQGLEVFGFRFEDITDILLTHIHLDHAGAAGWLAKYGARIHVHPYGAPHMINPTKLLSSAKRIYGEMMESLWGKFLPVPQDQVNIPRNGSIINIEGLEFIAIDTPGHANHHYAYLLGDICFTGDIGGVRLRNHHHISLPMPPPEFNLEEWKQSIKRLRDEHVSYIAPTHFDLYNDPDWHLDALFDALDEINLWIQDIMSTDPPIDKLQELITKWEHQRLAKSGIDNNLKSAHYAVNPPLMSAEGIYRYWYKYRVASE